METNIKNYRETVITAKDKITGFTGIVTGHADYITGCDQYLIQPPCKEGEFKEPRWVDEGRIEVIIGSTGLRIADLRAQENGSDAPAPVK